MSSNVLVTFYAEIVLFITMCNVQVETHAKQQIATANNYFVNELALQSVKENESS
jgi:hypothetical protein